MVGSHKLSSLTNITNTNSWARPLRALKNAVQLSCGRCGDSLTALMELMQIDRVVISHACGG